VLEVRDAIGACAERGATIVLSSHVLAEVQEVCTHAAIMRAGRLIASGTVSELLGEHASLAEAYLSLVGTDGAGPLP
jgi:ABC-2 type transport system ATP-binding protein